MPGSHIRTDLANIDMYKTRFPVYIISKGRWKRRPTASCFERIGVPYKIVVEEQEFEKYSKYVDKRNILILPKKYLDEYDTFWERAKDNKCGPGAARNFCWDHSIQSGFDWHWGFDDNIEAIERFNNNMKIECKTATPFYVCEDFVEACKGN